MGVFPYSPEPGTPAGTMHTDTPGLAVPDDVIERRIDELMTAQQRIVFARNAQLVHDGAQFDVLIDRSDDGTLIGRSARQAPEIDGITRVHSAQPLVPGELVPCRVTEFDGYDLSARPVDDADRRTRLHVVR